MVKMIYVVVIVCFGLLAGCTHRGVVRVSVMPKLNIQTDQGNIPIRVEAETSVYF